LELCGIVSPQKIHNSDCACPHINELDDLIREIVLTANGVSGFNRCTKIGDGDKGAQMRSVILSLLAASAIATLAAAPAKAVGTRYPFCIQGDNYPALGNCTFTSYQQCQATASGRKLWCIANPYYAGDNDPNSYLNHPRRPPQDPTLFDLFFH